GKIAGVTSTITLRYDVPANMPAVKSAMVGWRGYVTGWEPKTITAYLLENDSKSVCALGTVQTGNPIRESSFDEVLGVVSDVSVATEGGWTKDGYYPKTPRLPVDGDTYGSWSGSDTNTGTLRLGPFQIKNQAAVAIPLFSGPKNGGLLVRV